MASVFSIIEFHGFFGMEYFGAKTSSTRHKGLNPLKVALEKAWEEIDINCAA